MGISHAVSSCSRLLPADRCEGEEYLTGFVVESNGPICHFLALKFLRA